MNIIDDIKNDFEYQITKIPFQSIKNISIIIKENENNLHIGGVGKSGNIAKHCCDLLKSLSLKSFFFDTVNITHGDLGVFHENDIVMLFSNSGNTNEIISIIPLFIQKKCKVIGITCNNDSKFESLCDITLVLPLKQEVNNLPVPTNSVMSQLLFTNVLVSLLANNFDQKEYKLNHTSGNIALLLQPIHKFLIKDFPKVKVVKKKFDFNCVLIEMVRCKIGCCLFVAENDKIIGLVTDGDIRRYLSIYEQNKTSMYEIINKKFKFVSNRNGLISNYVDDLKQNNYLPVLDESGYIEGLLDYRSIIYSQ